MDIVARLRAERKALVARLAQIDKMLQQHDEWGREAQQLLSLTGTAKAASHLDHLVPVGSAAVAEFSEAERPELLELANARVRVRSRSSLPVGGRKTPIPEFVTAVIDVLRESGQPMDRVALYEALTARGVVIGSGGRDKDLNALSARIYRMAKDPKNRISGERGQGYWLTNDDEIAGSNAADETATNDADDHDLI